MDWAWSTSKWENDKQITQKVESFTENKKITEIKLNINCIEYIISFPFKVSIYNLIFLIYI